MQTFNFKDYLILVRLPNLFTLPSNVLVGYFMVSSMAMTSYGQILLLVTISILLYCVGLILNDLCDYSIDKKERPDRPLASGKVSRRAAVGLVVTFSTLALALSFIINITTFVISSILLITIFAYDKILKKTPAGPFTIGAARVMNVLLGASVDFGNIGSYPQYIILTFVLSMTFVYVSLIGFISRYEIHGFPKDSKLLLIPAIVAAIIFLILLFSFAGLFKYESLIMLVFFSFIMGITFYKFQKNDSVGIQRIVKNMIMSIIVLDSTFLSGIVGVEIGLVVLVLLAPLLILARKMYMT
jgi:4-hydroxybenzoate polyprenyltransferase